MSKIMVVMEKVMRVMTLLAAFNRRLISHITASRWEFRLGCILCGFTLSYSGSLRNHMETYHGEKTHLICS